MSTMNAIERLRWKPSDDVLSSADITSSKCMICAEPLNEPSYYTNHLDKTLGIHESCGQLPGEINHPLHPPHALTIFKPYFYSYEDYVCDACFTISTVCKYRCTTCRVNVCYPCIYNYKEGQRLKQKLEEDSRYHHHKIQLLDIHPDRNPLDEYPVCCCCHKFIEDSGRFCVRCRFSIHVSCLDTIPRRIQSNIHRHSLTARTSWDRDCKACLKRVDMIEFGCGDCFGYSFHVSCVLDYSSKLILRVNENIDLFYIDQIPFWNCCGICRQTIFRCPVYRSIELNQNFHVQCVVPPDLDHPCHRHPLTLTSSVQRRTLAERYRCDVCEEEEDFEHYVYHCEECDFNAYIECLFSEEFKPLRIDLPQFDEVEGENSSTEDEAEVEDSNAEDHGADEEGKDSITKDEMEDSNAEDNVADEPESDLEGSSLLELKEKMTSLAEHIKRLNEEINKSTVKFNRVKLMYDKKSNQ